MATTILPGHAEGPLLLAGEGLSFWGGVDPKTGAVIDTHHPLRGSNVAGAVLAMPTSRGSSSGSPVLLELIRNGRAPAALIFREPEDVLTLGALVAAHLFDKTLPVIRLDAEEFAALSSAKHVTIDDGRLEAGPLSVGLEAPHGTLDLSPDDRAMLDGRDGQAVRIAMRILCAMAGLQGASRLTDVTRAHIDGCIYNGPASLEFAELFADMGAQVRVPTTMNAISVDRANWQRQGVPPDFGTAASRLADAYIRMGARETYTCAPYLLEDVPAAGEAIAWAESNAVVYANSVLGARTAKHPDFLDLCMALTGRAPLAGVYLPAGRHARRIVAVDAPDDADDALWPLLGYLAGLAAPDRIPLLTGLDHLSPRAEDLKALCAAFGTTSAAPMLHIAGVTPEADLVDHDADHTQLAPADFARAWRDFNTGPDGIDLVAIGSPHASAEECAALVDLMQGQPCAMGVAGIVTLGRDVLAGLRSAGLAQRLETLGFRLHPDLCWCSITEPVFPPSARTVMTNSGKYAHYGPGLSGRAVRFGSLADCAHAARTGRAPPPPPWIG